MVIDHRLLKRHAAKGQFIAQDTPCACCRYNLKGLPRSGVCPECGAVIDPDVFETTGSGEMQVKRGPKGPRSVMDLSWNELGRLATAMSLFAWGISWFAGLMAVFWLRYIFLQHQWGSVSNLPFAIAMGAVGLPLTVMMVPGVFMLTSRWQDAGLEEHRHKAKGSYRQVLAQTPTWVLLLARVMILCWPLAVAAAGLTAMVTEGTMPHKALLAGSVLLFMGGMLALGALSIVLKELAYVVGDDLALHRSMLGVLGIPIAGGFFALSPVWGPLAMFDAIFAPATMFVGSLIVGLVPIFWMAGVLSLARSCRWARVSVIQHEEKDERQIAKAAAEAARINRTMRPPDESGA